MMSSRDKWDKSEHVHNNSILDAEYLKSNAASGVMTYNEATTAL
jgi:hypothetical protein